jgi:hypothetical protein
MINKGWNELRNTAIKSIGKDKDKGDSFSIQVDDDDSEG